MGVRDKDEDEEDDEKRSQRLGMVRMDARASADELRVRELHRSCNRKAVHIRRQSGGWIRQSAKTSPHGRGLSAQRSAYTEGTLTSYCGQRELLGQVRTAA